MKLVFGLSSPSSYILKTNFPVLVNQLRFRTKTWKNETWVDSGGYQIVLHGLEISPKEIIQKYKMIDAYAFFSLDIPSIFSPLDKRNFEYFEYLYTKIEYIEKIIPVIHIYPIQDVDDAIDFYKQYSYYFAVGGLIASSKMKALIYTFPWVFYVRRKVPYLHVLGMSAPYFIQAFDFAESMDTATHNKTTAYRDVFWFDGTRKFVGEKKTKREKYRLTEEEKEKLFEFLDKIHFPFEYDLSNRKILEVMNAYILVYNEWKIDNKYTRYADKLRKMGLDSLVTELIRNYKLGAEILKEKKNKKKKEDELELEI